MARYRVGVDIGGTFTDLVYFDEESKTFSVIKVSTTPKKPVEGVLNAIENTKIDLRDVEVLIHATTLGTNMFLGQEGLKLPKLALITTKGFRDIIEIGRQNRPELYNLFFEKPKPIVLRRDRYEVTERINAKGEILIPLNERELREIAKSICKKYEVVVVAFLHSYKNPIHEFKAKEIIKEVCPEIDVITSYEVDPEYKEFERFSTTVFNAFLKPMMSKYLEDLLNALTNKGFNGKLFIMQSNGGVSTVENAIKKPVAFIESGPASGAVAVAYYSRITGDKRIISFDMGGTTAKASTIINHEPLITTEYEVGGKIHYGRIVKGSGYPVRFPFIDLVEVSAGGGTVAWIDEGGALRVGPTSVGADPGPVCYGKGNTKPTITDANLVLGRLGDKLSGGLKLRKDLARDAIAKLADELGMEIEEVASGIIKLANMTMSKALRIVTIESGYDPRDFTMFAFGGAGGLHAVELAEGLNVKSILIPLHAGVFSAFGLLFSDYRVDKVKSVMRLADDIDDYKIEGIFSDLVNLAIKELYTKEIDIKIIKLVDLRYRGQAYEITVPWNGIEESLKAFHEKHEALYGFSSAKEEVEVVNLRVTVIGVMPKPKIECEKKLIEYTPKPDYYRDVYFNEWINTPVYSRKKLRAGAKIEGGAIIEDYDSTIVIPPDYIAIVDNYRNIRIWVKEVD